MDSTRSWKSGVLILATVVTAAGLNLGVMQLGQQKQKTATSSTVAPTSGTPATGQPAANGTGQPGADAAAQPADTAAPNPAGQSPPSLPSASTDFRSGQVAGTPPADGVTPSTRPPTATTQFLTYDVAGIATLVVAVDGTTSVQLAAATTRPGWSYAITSSQPMQVTLAFKNDTSGQTARVVLSIENGQLIVSGDQSPG